MFHITEKILIRQIKNGDEQAFTSFYNKYKQEIYRFIYFKTSDTAKAEDLLSDTFLKVFKYIQTGNEIENLRALLFKTARNLVIDFYRQKGRQDLLMEDSMAVNIPDKEASVVDKIDIKIDMDNVKQAIAKLSEPYKEIVILKFIQNLSFKEISQSTGKSEGNCRVIAFRGLKKLKKYL